MPPPIPSMPYAPKSLYTPRYADSIAQLLTRQGDIAAAGAARSGEIWGNAIGNLGQIAGQAVQGYAAHKEEQKQQKAAEERAAMFETAISTPWKEPMELYRRLAPVFGPEAAVKVAGGIASLQQKDAAPDMKTLAAKAGALRALNDKIPGYIEKNWASIMPLVAPEAKTLLGVELGETFTPEYAETLVALDDKLNPAKGAHGVATAPHVVGPGAALVGVGGEELYRAPAKPEKTVQEIEAESAARARGTASVKPPAAPPDELTFNPEGVVLSSYGVKQKSEVRKQAMERGLPVFENAATQNKGVVLAGIVEDAKELTALLALPEVAAAVGPVAGRWTQFKGSLTSLDPDVRRALQLMTSLSDTELRKRSGAQINEKEMQRLLRFTTDPNKPLDHNTTAVAGLLKSGARDYKALSGVDIGTPEASGTDEEPPDAR